MKKILTAFLGVFLLSSGARLHANLVTGDEPLRTGSDIVTFKQKASSDVVLGVSSGASIYTTYAIFNQVDVANAVQSGSSDAARFGGFTLSTITANTNNQLLFSSITAGGTTYLQVNISSSPTWPRNIICYSSTTIGASTTILVGFVQAFGLDGLGNTTMERVFFSTTFVIVGTGSVAAGTTNTWLYGQGRVAFSSISSFTIVMTSVSATFTLQTSTFSINIGYGNRLGFTNDVRHWSDVYKIVEDNGEVATAPGPVDTDYNTYTPTIVPNGVRTYRWIYRVRNSPKK